MSTNELLEDAIAEAKVAAAKRQGASMSCYRSFARNLVLGLATAGIAHAQAPALAAVNTDRHLWPEEVQGDQPMAGAIRHNAFSVKELQEKLGFPAMRTRFKTIINSEERIPHVSKNGEYYYNFWRDPQHVRGIWCRTTLPHNQEETTSWETVIDLDQLAINENENWVWAGVSCLHPKGERCLISLSRGGEANVVREYDVTRRAFVDDGFKLPESIGSASRIDQNTLLSSLILAPVR